MLVRNSLAAAVAVIVAVSSLVADEVQPEASSLFAEGYTDQLSYQSGENVRFHVSTTAPKWSLEIARLGAKTESVFTKNDIPSPTHRDGTPETFVILGTCPARWHPDDALWYDRFPRDADGAPAVGAAVMGVYTRGGTVFTAGTTDWSHGLKGDDKVVEQITRNVLDRLEK